MDKSIKKAQRKQHRCQEKVFNEIGVTFNSVPTQILMICNAGLANGLSQEKILQTLSQYGKVEQIIMLPKKTYCFIVHKSIEDSQKVFDAVHGKMWLQECNGPVYLAYANEAPKVESLCNDIKIPGLFIYKDFVNEEEEIKLLNINLDSTQLSETTNILKHRQVKHFGFEFFYETNNVDKNCPLEEKIPDQCNFISKRILEKGFKKNFVPDQLTINKYLPGQGIPPHIDTHSAFEDPIISLSLGSSAVMEFRNSNGICVPIVLPQRSLLIMSGEARYAWSHGITPRTMDVIPTENGLTIGHRNVRVSFTFRKILNGECDCDYAEFCDSQMKLKQEKRAIKNEMAKKLEYEHVHQVYDEIASHFSDTRHKPWPRVLEFVNSFPVGSILVDVGCGNGKYLGHNKNIFELGCDRSLSLLKICQEKQFNVFNCDCLAIPLLSNKVDCCISIAVIHHLASQERRFQAILEITRILRVGGKALIYVWAKNQKTSNYIKQTSNSSGIGEKSVVECGGQQNNDISLPVHTNRTEFQHQDLLVPWKLKPKKNEPLNTEPATFLRYYHVFDENELEKMCKRIPNIKVDESYYDQGNWCVILQKINIL